MIAFSTESESAITSMIEIAQSSQLALVPNTADAKFEKIVFGSTLAGSDSLVAPSTITKLTGIIV